MTQITDTSSFSLLAGEAAFDPIEERLRTNVRATIEAETGKQTEWRSKALPRYQRLTKSEEDQKTAWGAVFPTNEALIAAVYLSGTKTRRVKRALFGLFEGAVEPRTSSAAPGAR